MSEPILDQPGALRLFMTWLFLMGLTLFSMWSAQLGDDSQSYSLPLWSVCLVLLSAGFKAQQILMIYLNLRVSSAGWRGGFLSLLALTLVLVGFAYWFAR